MPYHPLLPAVLNIDLGELEDEPAELLGLAGMANVACGGHAGDERMMARVADGCRGRIVAHPSYPDREGFGRRSMAMAPEALRAEVRRQCARLRAVTSRVEGVKPHGALYHDANRDLALAQAVVAGAVEALGSAISVVAPPTGRLADAALAAGLGLWREGFADRGMQADGALLPRSAPGAVLGDPEEAVAQARRLLATGVIDTLCVHGDQPQAVAVARAVARVVAAWNAGEGRGANPGWRDEAPTVVLPRDDARVDRLRAGAVDVAETDVEVALWLRDGALEAPGDVSAARRTATRAPREHRIRVRYDGEDLIEVAERIGVTTSEVARVHAAARWTVRFLGFLPGFAYLESDDWPWDLPRRASPRPSVPARALAVAGRRCGVYPDASPGGWNLLGTAEGWPALVGGASALAPGDLVRFEPAALSEEPPSLGAPAEEDVDGVWLEVVSVAGPAWLQDEGRVGRRQSGVPRGGPLVPRQLARVRAAVPGAGLPAIEHVGPLRLRLHGGPTVVAFGGVPDGAPEVVSLTEGDTVDVPAPTGRVGHVVVGGGFDVPAALGGRGWLTAGAAIWADPSALPARPLRAGDRLPIRDVPARPLPRPAAPESPVPVPPAWEGPTPYGLIPFVPLDPDRAPGVCSARWTITVASRVGLRLRGPALRPPAPLVGSRVTWPGAVQLPPDGQPIVLGPDHGVTGGYPILGSVPAWGELFARRDGAEVRFFAVDPDRLARG